MGKKELQRDETGFVSHCPKCGTKLEVDNSFPTAGWCPHCQAYYRWGSGKRVPDRFSFPREIMVEMDGVRIFHYTASPFIVLRAWVRDIFRVLFGSFFDKVRDYFATTDKESR